MNLETEHQTLLNGNTPLTNKSTRQALGSVSGSNQAQKTVEKTAKKPSPKPVDDGDAVDTCYVQDAFDLEHVYAIEEHEKFTRFGAEGPLKCMVSVCWPFKWSSSSPNHNDDYYEKSELFQSWEGSQCQSQNMSPRASPRPENRSNTTPEFLWD